MGTLNGNMFAGKPIIPMRPPKYIKNPPRSKAVRIKKFKHENCPGNELILKARPANGPEFIGYYYYLTCAECKKTVGEMRLPHGLDKAIEINKFIAQIGRD